MAYNNPIHQIRPKTALSSPYLILCLGGIFLFWEQELEVVVREMRGAKKPYQIIIFTALTFQFRNIIFCSLFYHSRHSYQPFAHHGQASLGPVRVIQSSPGSRGSRRSHQQEAVARSHQGSWPTLIYHISSIHPENTVSKFCDKILSLSVIENI